MNLKRVIFTAAISCCFVTFAFAAPSVDVGILQMQVNGAGAPLGYANLTNNPAIISQVQTSTTGAAPWTTVPNGTATIAQYMNAAYNNGSWTGTTGIGSSVAANNAGFIGLGYNSGAEYTANYSTFYGIAPAATDTLIKCTYVGDFNLDGVVDINDLLNFLNYFDPNNPTPGVDYSDGDTDFNGVIDTTDLLNFLNNYPITSPVLSGSGIKAVPEPGTISLLVIAAGMALFTLKRRIA
jgi:hypothetical protein